MSAAETVAFNLLFAVQADRALAAMNDIDQRLDRLGNNALQEAAKMRAAFGSMGSNAFSGLRQGIAGLGTELRTGVKSAADYAGSLSPIGGRLVAIGGAAGGVAVLGVAALGAAMIAGGFAAGRLADQIDDMANSLSVSNGFLQIQSAAVTRAGGDAAAFEKSMAKLNVKIGEAALGNPKATAAFSALGISVKDAGGKIKDNEDLFEEARAKLSGVTSETERASLANDLFGKGHKDMAGILSMSAAEYANLKKEVASYGVATDENIAKAGKLGDGMDALGQAMQAGVINAFAGVAGAMGEFAMDLAPMVGRAFEFIGGVVDTTGAIVRILFDGFKVLWDVLSQGVRFVMNLISPFTSLIGRMRSTGDSSRSMRDQFLDTLQSMLRGAGNITGSIAAFFARMSARIYNSVADIKNGIVNAGLGGLFGLSGTVAKVDVNAVGEAARSISRGAFDRAAGGVDRYRARPGEAGDDRRDDGTQTTAGESPAAKAAKKAKDEAAEAAKKYAAELARLKTATDEAAYSEEQKAIAAALAAAGLPRIVDETNAHSRAIRDQVLALREAEAQARVVKTIENLAQKTADAALSAEDLAVVEARRAAGVSDVLTVTNEYIAKLDEQARATYRAAEALKLLKANADVAKDLAAQMQEAQWDGREIAGGDRIQIDYEREIQGIKDQTAAMRERILASTTEGEQRDRQLAQLKELEERQKKNAEAAKERAEAERMADQVDTLAAKLEDLWTRPREAFAAFVKDVILGFAKMAAANLFNGNGFSNGMGLGGMLKSAMGSALGFGGFKASGGGVRAGQGHIVGENGREYFRPHTDGDIIPASALGGSTINEFNAPFHYHAAPGGAGGGQAEMQKAEEMKRMMTQHVNGLLNQAGFRT
jgi:hypothetical protein